MVEKRKLPARERRESAAKRQATSPPPAPPPKRHYTKRVHAPAPPTPPAPASEPTPPVTIEDALPKKIKDGQPLPILREAQAPTLSDKEYQTVAESAVLAASLQRSRSKWLAGGIFERYWTKPSKKKGQPEVPNPPNNTMHKLGQCSLNIEPHHFDITLYTVREPQAAPPPQSYQNQQRPFLQYGTPNGFHQYQPPPNAHPQAIAPHPQPTPPNSHPPPNQAPSQPGAPQPSWQAPPPPTPTAPPPQSQQPPPKPSPDPVIQMLATRAASDPELKALMRVVASSKATQAQLRAFQAHIDELNALIAQNANKPNANPPAYSQQQRPPNQANGHGSPPSTANSTPAPPASTAPPRSSPSPYGPYQPSAAHPQGPSHSAPNQPIRAKAPLAAYPPYPPHNPYPVPKPDPTAIVFEFLSPANSTINSSGDRFLFPAYSILDYLPGNTQVVVSFLVVQKGSAIITSNPGSNFYDPKTEYYQPVTMRLSASNAKTLEVLSRVVKTAGEVRKYMEDVMERGKRAEYVHLATRLPRGDGEGEETGGDKTDVDASAEKAEPVKVETVKETYEAPSWVTPFKGWGWNWA